MQARPTNPWHVNNTLRDSLQERQGLQACLAALDGCSRGGLQHRDAHLSQLHPPSLHADGLHLEGLRLRRGILQARPGRILGTSRNRRSKSRASANCPRLDRSPASAVAPASAAQPLQRSTRLLPSICSMVYVLPAGGSRGRA